MLVGDPRYWIDRFRRVDVRFLERVHAVWSRCVGVLPQDPDEDTITMNLVDIVSKDAVARRLFHYLEFHYEPLGYTADGLAYSKGQIDMAVLLDQERDRYLAYECKRLNELRSGVTRSLATRYVLEGLYRFVTEQYAAGLPVGCMLGYVMDGNARSARLKVGEAIVAQQSKVRGVGGLSDHPSVGVIRRFSSRHGRGPAGSVIEIRHALLPFPATARQNARGRMAKTGVSETATNDAAD